MTVARTAILTMLSRMLSLISLMSMAGPEDSDIQPLEPCGLHCLDYPTGRCGLLVDAHVAGQTHHHQGVLGVGDDVPQLRPHVSLFIEHDEVDEGWVVQAELPYAGQPEGVGLPLLRELGAHSVRGRLGRLILGLQRETLGGGFLAGRAAGLLLPARQSREGQLLLEGELVGRQLDDSERAYDRGHVLPTLEVGLQAAEGVDVGRGEKLAHVALEEDEHGVAAELLLVAQVLLVDLGAGGDYRVLAGLEPDAGDAQRQDRGGNESNGQYPEVPSLDDIRQKQPGFPQETLPRSSSRSG